MVDQGGTPHSYPRLRRVRVAVGLVRALAAVVLLAAIVYFLAAGLFLAVMPGIFVESQRAGTVDLVIRWGATCIALVVVSGLGFASGSGRAAMARFCAAAGVAAAALVFTGLIEQVSVLDMVTPLMNVLNELVALVLVLAVLAGGAALWMWRSSMAPADGAVAWEPDTVLSFGDEDAGEDGAAAARSGVRGSAYADGGDAPGPADLSAPRIPRESAVPFGRVMGEGTAGDAVAAGDPGDPAGDAADDLLDPDAPAAGFDTPVDADRTSAMSRADLEAREAALAAAAGHSPAAADRAPFPAPTPGTPAPVPAAAPDRDDAPVPSTCYPSA